MGRFKKLVESTGGRVPLPLATYPAVALSGHTIRDLVTNAGVQASAHLNLQRHLKSDVLLTCMDLSVEAEAFGATIRFSDSEIPSVTGRTVTDPEEIGVLRRPSPGSGRTTVYIETVRRLRDEAEGRPILAGMIGPFSLAGRLYGAGESLLATAADPDLVLLLLDRTTEFLIDYARELKNAGADGVIIAEPTAGLLSPKSLGTFSSPCVRRIIEQVEDASFDIILHNCGAKANHLDFIEQSGASIVHFGAPMDIVAALRKLSSHVIVCGNLDPSAVFVHSSPPDVARMTRDLLAQTSAFPRFVPSSGCDIPAGTSLAHLQAFLREVRDAGGRYPAHTLH